jgi:transposase
MAEAEEAISRLAGVDINNTPVKLEIVPDVSCQTLSRRQRSPAHLLRTAQAELPSATHLAVTQATTDLVTTIVDLRAISTGLGMTTAATVAMIVGMIDATTAATTAATIAPVVITTETTAIGSRGETASTRPETSIPLETDRRPAEGKRTDMSIAGKLRGARGTLAQSKVARTLDTRLSVSVLLGWNESKPCQMSLLQPIM